MKSVTFICLPDCLASSISLPLEMLNAADNLQRSKTKASERLIQNIASLQEEKITTAGGLTLLANCHFQSIEKSDVIFLPALWRNPLRSLKKNQELLKWLQKMYRQNSIICAVGTSSCYMAEAGLLDNKPATTHWYFFETFKQRYPKVNLKPNFIITQADNLYCAGSVNSVADLVVHLIEKSYGSKIAHGVESQFSPEIRRDFASHAYSEDQHSLHHDELIIEAQEWLRHHAQETINLAELAKSLKLSVRSFNRRFKQATEITATEFLLNCRLNNAKDLLKNSNLSIAEVAEQAGFIDSSYFCSRFKKNTGQTPLSYRKSVRGKLFQMS